MTVALAILAWLALWALNVAIARSRFSRTAAARVAVPVIFGISLLILWQGLVRGLGVSPVILPAPTDIAARFAAETGTLWGDFVQTVLKGALSGFLIGCAAAFATAIAIDRSPFLTRGLLPVGNFVAALPIVGIAPILVGWTAR